jgi:ABC-type transport system substrate-binding protein
VGPALGIGVSRLTTSAAAAVFLALAATSGCATAAGKTPTSDASAAPQKKAAASSTPSPMLTPTAPASTPLGAGERVWAAFSQRGVAYDAWWARLKPLLSDSAQAVYVYDDPRKIPAMTITGKLHLAAKAPDQAGFTAEVVVPTSKGVFRLDLERRTLKSPWLLYAIKFPAGVH